MLKSESLTGAGIFSPLPEARQKKLERLGAEKPFLVAALGGLNLPLIDLADCATNHRVPLLKEGGAIAKGWAQGRGKITAKQAFDKRTGKVTPEGLQYVNRSLWRTGGAYAGWALNVLEGVALYHAFFNR